MCGSMRRRAATATLIALALMYFALSAGGQDSYGAKVLRDGPLSVFTISARSTSRTVLMQSCARNVPTEEVVLVTGAAGFVGSHVATALKRRGAGVIGLDNVNDYYPRGLKRARIQKLKDIGVHTVVADLNEIGRAHV